MSKEQEEQQRLPGAATAAAVPVSNAETAKAIAAKFNGLTLNSYFTDQLRKAILAALEAKDREHDRITTKMEADFLDKILAPPFYGGYGVCPTHGRPGCEECKLPPQGRPLTDAERQESDAILAEQLGCKVYPSKETVLPEVFVETAQRETPKPVPQAEPSAPTTKSDQTGSSVVVEPNAESRERATRIAEQCASKCGLNNVQLIRLSEAIATAIEETRREAHQTCNGSCDIALARRQVGPDGVVPGNARECAHLWERQAARSEAERDRLRAELSATQAACAAIMENLRWTGDGYEWNPKHGDYREHPDDALKRGAQAHETELSKLRAESRARTERPGHERA